MAWTKIQQTQYKLARYYSDLLFDLMLSFQQGGAQAPLVLTRFDAERPMMLHFIDCCFHLAADNREAAENYLRFVLSGSDLFKLRLSVNERIEMRQKALKVARINQFKDELARLLVFLSDDYTNTGEFDKAIKYAEEAVSIAPLSTDPSIIRLAHIALAYTYVVLGKLEKAQPHVTEIANLEGGLTDPFYASSFHFEMGNISTLKGDQRQAIEHYQQALQIAEQQGNLRTKIACLYGLAMAHNHLHQYRLALSYAEQSRNLSRSLGDRRNESMALSQLGRIFMNKRNYSRTIHYLKLSIELKEQEDKLGLAYEYNNLGQAYAYAGYREKALENLAIARTFFVELKNEEWIKTVDEAIEFNQSPRSATRGRIMKLIYWNIK
jgi:tetratricopeptide (TPR) repeat protein